VSKLGRRVKPKRSIREDNQNNILRQDAKPMGCVNGHHVLASMTEDTRAAGGWAFLYSLRSCWLRIAYSGGLILS
jgi:hypothetical protein